MGCNCGKRTPPPQPPPPPSEAPSTAVTTQQFVLISPKGQRRVFLTALEAYAARARSGGDGVVVKL